MGMAKAATGENFHEKYIYAIQTATGEGGDRGYDASGRIGGNGLRR